MTEKETNELKKELQKLGKQCLVLWAVLLILIFTLPLFSDVSWSKVLFAEFIGIGILVAICFTILPKRRLT